MFVKSIKYTDFNGQEREEKFYFHLSKPEVIKLQAKFGMTLAEKAKEVTSKADLDDLLEFLEIIVLDSYGKKTEDGRSFIKSPEIRQSFEYSQAYADFFEEMLLTPNLAKEFGEKVADDGKKNKESLVTVPAQ